MTNADALLKETASEFAAPVAVSETPPPANDQSLRDHVERSVTHYFEQLDGHDVTDVYDMVIAEVEAPLLTVVMKYTRHNQTRAASVLGLNRGTLRKKLKRYGLL